MALIKISKPASHEDGVNMHKLGWRKDKIFEKSSVSRREMRRRFCYLVMDWCFLFSPIG
jgi:hypothetical protein